MGGDTDGFDHILRKVITVNVYWNTGNGEWNVNAYRRDHIEWNAGNQVFRSNSLFLPRFYFWEVFATKPFFHPPSILPTSDSVSPSAMYFLLSKALISQES